MAATHTTGTTVTDLLFEKAAVGLCLVAPDGTIVRANREWLRSTGFSAEQVVGEDLVDLFPRTRDMALAMHARARAGHRVEVPRHVQVVNGRETWWEGSIDPVAMDGGTGLLITAREVSSTARATPDAVAEQARHDASRLRTLIATLPVGVIVCDERGRLTLANGAAHELVGGITGDASGPTSGYTLHHPGGDPFPPDELPLVRAVRGEAVQGVEVVARRADGTERVLLSSGVPVRDEGGEPRGAIAVVQDITDRKLHEAALRASEERFRLLADAMPQIVCVLAPDASVEYVNATWRSFSGLDLAATARAGWEAIIHPDDVAAARECRRRALKQLRPQDVELRYRGADATYRWFLSRLAPVVDRGGRVRRFIGAAIDIELRKRAEEALRESEAELRVAQRIAHVGSWSWAVGTSSLDASEEVLRIYGRDPARPIPANDSDELRRHYTAAGWERRTAAFRKALLDGEPWERDEEILRLDGSVRWVHFRGEPVRDAAGAIVKLRGTIQDITERKLAEEALREADRRKDEFLGMLSHELRNPLAPIRNSTYILQHAAPGSEQARRAQTVIQRQTEHLTRLVDDLLDVTRIARGKVELRRSRVDLRHVVERAADDFRSVMRDRGIRFDVALPDEPLWADTDATRITQIVGNLLHNASKFTRRGDTVAVSLAKDAAGAELRVRDTGAGIDAALLPRIFDAFVQAERTLARTEGGLGLGLALVRGITELHGGTVRAESAGKGRGAEFIVRLPLAETAPAPRPAVGHVQHASRGRRVLVVDDNADAAESLAEVVTMLGHSVEVTYDGAAAVESARANPPDVVLCDIGLPGMSGYEVAHALRAAGLHGVQLIAVSGYALAEDVKRADEAGFDAHVAKPCDPERIEQLLG